MIPTSPPLIVPSVRPTEEDEIRDGKCIASINGSGRQCNHLVGRDGSTFGEVCVEMFDDESDRDDDQILVTYEVFGTYRMTRKHLWLGDLYTSQVPVITGEQDATEPDLDAFPHYAW